MANETKQAKNAATVEAAEEYVKNLLESNSAPDMYFHNFDHALKVRETVQEIGEEEKITNKEAELLSLAALFHDVGFIETYEGHEEVSQRIATEYLRRQGFSEEDIHTVNRLIATTKMNTKPNDLLEQIITDADMAHLGQKKYGTVVGNLRREREKFFKKDYKDLEWEKSNLEFLENHVFYTKTANDFFKKRKRKNIAKAEKKIKGYKDAEQKRLDALSIGKNKAAQVMFKTALRNHIDLTSIADQKSNIMLSINALLLTIGMPVFASYLTDKVYLLAPSICFMLTCIGTMVFATLSTRPIKMDGETNLKKLKSGKSNLFFFGNFYKIEQDEYITAIKKVIASNDLLDKSIINDLYFLGHALGDKFRYLRTCYNVFIIGIIISFIAFAISYYIHVPEITEIVKDAIQQPQK